MSTAVIIFLALVAVGVLTWALMGAYVDVNGLPWNPLRWKAERLAQRDRATAYRISRLEHQLGYTPCSDDLCTACAKDAGVDRLWLFARSRTLQDALAAGLLSINDVRRIEEQR